VFALCLEKDTRAVRDAMVQGFTAHGIEADRWIAAVQSGGAHVVHSE
jgi:hypothetical protein